MDRRILPHADIAPNNAFVVNEPTRSLMRIGWLSYGLHLLVALAAVVPSLQVSVVVLVVSFILDLVYKENAQGTWQESHFDWRLKSVVWAGVAYVLTAPLWLLLFVPGWIAWGVISIWFLYRIIKGMARMHAQRAIV